MEFNTISEAVADIRKGKLIVVVDDKDRENEGDVVFAASKSTPAKINFLAKHARGLICVALSAERTEELRLTPMADMNLSRHDTAFTVSVEVREGTTTGISAADRSATAKALGDDKVGHEEFIRPGHTFPIKARKGGVLVRAGHTEAAVDLVGMAGLGMAGVICEIMNDDGTMARLKDNLRFAKKHKLKIISVQDLIEYRRSREKLVRQVASPELPTRHGHFKAYVYEDVIDGRRHLAMVRGAIDPSRPVNVRVHSQCMLGEVLGSVRCDCGRLLNTGMDYIAKHGGVFLYMRQTDPEADLARKLDTYQREDDARNPAASGRGSLKQPPGKRQGRTVSHHGSQMDDRTYGIGAQILSDLGVRNLHLLTNHPKRIQGLEGYGLHITKQLPLAPTRKDGAVESPAGRTPSATRSTSKPASKTVSKTAATRTAPARKKGR